MPWILIKAPEDYSGPALSEDDLGTIKIALASAATTQLDFWGRTHDMDNGTNIYDQALDRVIDMEEAESPYVGLPAAEDYRDIDPLIGLPRARPESWFGHVLKGGLQMMRRFLVASFAAATMLAGSAQVAARSRWAPRWWLPR